MRFQALTAQSTEVVVLQRLVSRVPRVDAITGAGAVLRRSCAAVVARLELTVSAAAVSVFV